jgi:hypothetical protein
LQKLVWIEDSEAPKFDFLEDLGSYNHMPKPFREVDLSTLWNCLNTKTVEYVEYRQIMNSEINKGDDIYPLLSCRLLFFHDCVLAVFTPRIWHCSDDPINYLGIKYTDGVRVFRAGCEHNYQEIADDWLTKTVKCTKCGYEHRYPVN